MENNFVASVFGRIAIIGSGNVAYHLAKAFVKSDLPLIQVFGRNEEALVGISREVGIPYSTTDLADADLYIIAVSDSSISEVSALIKNKNALVAHTSGSTPMEILQGDFRRAVLYPLQTFSKTKALDYSKIPFFIEAENQLDEVELQKLVEKISKNVMICNSEKRKYIHLTAVFSCNFVNHLFSRGKEIADEQGIPFDFFVPLIEETIDKIHYLDPKTAQTGPAVRGDQSILALHEELITNPEQAEIYKVMNKSIQKMYF